MVALGARSGLGVVRLSQLQQAHGRFVEQVRYYRGRTALTVPGVTDLAFYALCCAFSQPGCVETREKSQQAAP